MKTTMTTEVWKDLSETKTYKNVKGYKVSNFGNVITLKNGVWVKVALRNHNRGYFIVSLKDEFGKRKNALVHRLVCMAFVGEAPSKKYTVDHIDGNKKNNRADNLEWITMREQKLRSFARDGVKVEGGRKKKVAQKTLDGKLIQIHNSMIAGARAVGKDYSGSVYMACNGLLETYMGYKWEYVKEPLA